MLKGTAELTQEYQDIPQGFFISNDIAEVASNDKLKKELVSRIAPINSIYNLERLNLATVNEFVLKFSDELIEKEELVKDISFVSLFIQFVRASGGLLGLNPEQLSVEVTSSKSLLFRCKKKTTSIYLEVFFDDINGKFSEAVLNIYENRNQQLADSGTVNALILKVSQYFSQSLQVNYQYFQPAYALPGNTPTAYAF